MDVEKKEELKKKLLDIKSLKISRVTKETYLWFTRLADEKFASDYGMTLQFLKNSLEEDWKYKMLDKRLIELEKKVKEIGNS